MSQNISQQIQAKLQAELKPTYMEVINESDGHNVPKGSQTHFKIVCAADEFESLKAVQRHRRVYQILADELANGVHALALSLYSPSEWQDAGGAPESPPCLGGEKP